MKARVKLTGRVIEVTEKTSWNKYKIYVCDDTFYRENELDFDLSEPEEEVKKIHGWVAIDEPLNDCYLHTLKPTLISREFCDTGEYDTIWESDGKSYLLDKGLFPDMDSDSDPVECEITITIKTKKK